MKLHYSHRRVRPRRPFQRHDATEITDAQDPRQILQSMFCDSNPVVEQDRLAVVVTCGYGGILSEPSTFLFSCDRHPLLK